MYDYYGKVVRHKTAPRVLKRGGGQIEDILPHCCCAISTSFENVIAKAQSKIKNFQPLFF